MPHKHVSEATAILKKHTVWQEIQATVLWQAIVKLFVVKKETCQTKQQKYLHIWLK